jgi:glycosyltransferase involved in cell wall biosynthesis
MNNFGLCVVRYLRDLGYDAELVLFEEEAAHFHPSADSFDLSYQAYTRSVPWGSSFRFSDVPIADVAREIAGYDQVWGCGVMPAYFQKMQRTLDVFFPYGSDLEGLTRFPGIPFRRRSVRSFFELPYRQRLGIRHHCRAVAMDPSPWFEAKLREVGFRGQHIGESVPLVYQPAYADVSKFEHRSFWAPILRELRARHDFIIFHPTRHIWRPGAAEANGKGNDRLLRAFARLVKERKRPAHLITTEYGPDVSASRSLIDELGVADHVTWLPVMPRREVMVAFNIADIAAGDFHVGWHTGGVVFEAFASSTPLVHYRNESSLSRAERDALPPILPAHSELEILEVLSNFPSQREAYRQVGKRAQAWLAQNSGAQQVERIARAAGLRRVEGKHQP